MRDRAATSNARTPVSKDKDAGGVPSCFERRAARLSRRGLRELTCAARLLSMRAGEGGACTSKQASAGTTIFDGREEPTCGCRKRCVTRAPCFRPVLYRELCNRSAWLGYATRNPEDDGCDSPSGSRRLERRCWGPARKQPASVENRRGRRSIVSDCF